MRAQARQGCCSHHGGVGNCRCNDGTPLSATCKPYYPECNGGSASAPPAASHPSAPTNNRFSTGPKRTKGSSFYCNVTSVHDGDTLTCSENGQAYKIRLNGIDAPELAQTRGQDAQRFSENMVGGHQVRILVTDIDRYGRLVSDVVLGDKRLNYELVRAGWAWWYQAYSKDQNLSVLEQRAKSSRIGLWADVHPQAPWDYRKSHR